MTMFQPIDLDQLLYTCTRLRSLGINCKIYKWNLEAKKGVVNRTLFTTLSMVHPVGNAIEDSTIKGQTAIQQKF